MIPFISHSQGIDSIGYLFPIHPGQQNFLAGTVGEIRTSHFHTGIDVKTGGKTGLPIYAVADGYITRVKVSGSGYGHSLYMQHPNGTNSVYAHLEAFDPALEKWVIEQQYAQESFEVDLFPDKDQFQFSRGKVIAFTGNSGSSTGPHLHFEIRNKENDAIDVLSLGFKEIQDHLPPVVEKIAFVTLDDGARVNGLFGRHEFELTKRNDTYTTSIPVHLQGKIGIEIYSYDVMNGVPNQNGIVRTLLFVDGVPCFGESKTLLSFDKQRNALVHYNYPATKQGRKKFNRLYLADGNELTFYTTINRGIHFQNQSEITIHTLDSHQNKSVTSIKLSREIPERKSWVPEMEIIDNFIHFRSQQPVSIQLNEWLSIPPYHTEGKDKYYIWDLRKGTPKSAFVNGKTIKTNYVSTLPPNQQISYVQSEFNLDLSERSIFDTLYLAFEKRYDSLKNLELFQFQNAKDPIRSNISITLKPTKEYRIDASVYSVFGNRYYYVGGLWNGNQITFSTRDLVTYTLLRDTIPPQIEPRVVNTNDLKFRIRDDLSGIQSFRAELNGKFILMYYEPKSNLIWSRKLDQNILFQGEFSLEVIDRSNNKTTYTKKL